ncbi:T9SS type A sorting domain-containing protein [Flaviaesturariibacter amylovorans]|uniref:T9SS type A sorting domain-containing protein n=1 Tax=Flaviaesturariibacter amylovorans TaxID=1084520 RepID=A0ABP8HD26_9BACT
MRRILLAIGLLAFPAAALKAQSAHRTLPVNQSLSPESPASSHPQRARPQVARSAALAATAVRVSAGGGSQQYNTLKEAFDAINAGTHQGTITVEILENTTETAPCVLNASGTGAANYSSVLVQPVGARTITGNIGAVLVDLYGADNVTIDGLNSGGNSLTLENTNASFGAGAVGFQNDASGNTLRNCTVLGAATGSNMGSASAVVICGFGNSTGNDSNTVANNRIGASAAGLPYQGVVCNSGSSIVDNNDFQVLNNEVFNVFSAAGHSAAIALTTGAQGTLVSGNKIYQTALRTATVNSYFFGVYFANSAGRATISSNTIGFADASGTGLSSFSGLSMFRGVSISLSTTTLPRTQVQNNRVSGISVTTSRASAAISIATFAGIETGLSSGVNAPADVTGNTIGSLDGSSAVSVTAATGSSALVIGIGQRIGNSGGSTSGNSVGNLTISSASGVNSTLMYSIAAFAFTNNTFLATISNNTIGGSSTGAIRNEHTGNAPTYGIFVSGVAASVTGNTVQNMQGNHNFNNSLSVTGIFMSNGGLTTQGVSTISDNTVRGLSNATTAPGGTYIYGMWTQFVGSGHVVERNRIYGLTGTSLISPLIAGHILQGSGGITLRNNFISLGWNAQGGVHGASSLFAGIYHVSTGNVNLYHNSIQVGGSNPGTNVPSYAIIINGGNSTSTLRNNIFANSRSNVSGGSGTHTALTKSNNSHVVNADYNVLHKSGPDAIAAMYNGTTYAEFGDYMMFSGQEAHGSSADPRFVDAPNGNLHVSATNGFLIAGTPVGVDADIDGDSRSQTVPTIGADEVYCSAPTLSHSVTDACGASANGIIDLNVISGSAPFTYSWSGPNGFSATTQDLRGVPAGSYQVTVSTNGGCSVSTGVITVGSVPTPSATIAYAGTPYCAASGTAAVTQTGTAGGTYSATPAGLSIDAATGAIDLAASTPGTYTVRYTLASGACNLVVTTPVSVRPETPFLPAPNRVYCAGVSTGTLAFAALPDVSYTWTNDNPAIGLAASGTGDIPSFTAQNGTDAPIYATIRLVPESKDGCSFKPVIFRVTVKPVPVMNGVSGQLVCAGEATAPVTFSSSLTAPILYSWTNQNPSIGIGASGAGSLPSFTARNNTPDVQNVATFTVVPSLSGCSGTPLSFVIAARRAVLGISYPQASYCAAGSINATIAGSTGGTFTATPAGLGLDAATGGVVLSASAPGTYTVTYTVAPAGGCAGTATTQLTVKPQASVSAIPNSTLCNGVVAAPITFPGTATSYTWVNSNTSIGLGASGTGTALPSFTAINAGATAQHAYIRVTPQADANSCVGKPIAFRITVNPCGPIAGLGDTNGNGDNSRTLNTMSLQPNPARSTVRVSYNGTAAGLTVEVRNTVGGSALAPRAFTGNGMLLNVSSLLPGTYYVVLTDRVSGTRMQQLLVKL